MLSYKYRASRFEIKPKPYTYYGRSIRKYHSIFKARDFGLGVMGLLRGH